jgi:hypothetical protein
MKYNQHGDLENTFMNWLTIVSYLWLFASVVGGLVHTVQYLYAHLRWIA